MEKITRRQALSTLSAAVPACGVTAIIPTQVTAADPDTIEISRTLLETIDVHQKAAAYFNEVCDCCDTIKLGRPATEADERKYEQADQAERQALMALCTYRPINQGEARFKAAYLLGQHSWWNGYLEPEHVAVLLKSMI